MHQARRIQPFAITAALLAIASAAVAESAEAPWMPIEVGVKKTFAHRQDRSLHSQGASLGDERWVGTRVEQYLPAPAEFPEATAEMRVTTHTASAAGEETETQQMFVSPNGAGYQVHAAKLEAAGERFLLSLIHI